ncbi:MAG: ABC transporter permease [Methanobacteriota archaeon]|nr:MAG: ABC transporter permease [Euryarchaeota archaeon]
MARGHSLLAYALTRMALAVPMLLILLTAVFIILRILPGDPVLALWGGHTPPPEVVEAARQQLGLDKPWYVQYWNYMTDFLQGKFGISIGEQYRGTPVWNQISQRLPATIELSIGSMFVATVVGVGAGIVAGSRRDTWVDVAIRLYGTIVWVIPIFWLGLIFQLIFGVWLHWLPPQGRWTGTDIPRGVTGMYTVDALLEGNLAHFWKATQHLILPSLTLGLVLSGFFTKTVRANMLQTVTADYSDAARARGVPERRVITRHAFRNALVPVVTVLGLQFAILFAGAVLTERTFSIEGIGQLLLTSITSKDMTMIQGVVVVYASIIVVISLVVDILGAMIDPRIRL